MKVHRGEVHKYLGVFLDFSHKPVTKQQFKTPAPDNLFIVNEDCDKLSEAVSADFHTIVAKTLYVTKRARPPDTDDWEKLSSDGVPEGQS
jgi:hypothetical protein